MWLVSFKEVAPQTLGLGMIDSVSYAVAAVEVLFYTMFVNSLKIKFDKLTIKS